MFTCNSTSLPKVCPITSSDMRASDSRLFSSLESERDLLRQSVSNFVLTEADHRFRETVPFPLSAASLTSTSVAPTENIAGFSQSLSGESLAVIAPPDSDPSEIDYREAGPKTYVKTPQLTSLVPNADPTGDVGLFIHQVRDEQSNPYDDPMKMPASKELLLPTITDERERFDRPSLISTSLCDSHDVHRIGTSETDFEDQGIHNQSISSSSSSETVTLPGHWAEFWNTYFPEAEAEFMDRYHREHHSSKGALEDEDHDELHPQQRQHHDGRQEHGDSAVASLGGQAMADVKVQSRQGVSKELEQGPKSSSCWTRPPDVAKGQDIRRMLRGSRAWKKLMSHPLAPECDQVKPRIRSLIPLCLSIPQGC